MNPQQSSFFSKLFDMNFKEYVTPSIIQVVFLASIVVSGLIAVAVFVGLASQGGLGLIGGLIIAPVFFLVYVIIARVSLEGITALFAIAENTAVHARRSQQDLP